MQQNKINNIPYATLDDIKAIIANTNATVPRPMFVRWVVFVRPNDWFGDEDERGSSSRPVATLSIPMINNVIESSVIVVFTGRIGYSIAIIHIDNISDIMPLHICKERNHAGGGGRRLLLITNGVMKLSIHSDVEILFVCYKTLI